MHRTHTLVEAVKQRRLWWAAIEGKRADLLGSVASCSSRLPSGELQLETAFLKVCGGLYIPVIRNHTSTCIVLSATSSPFVPKKHLKDLKRRQKKSNL